MSTNKPVIISYQTITLSVGAKKSQPLPILDPNLDPSTDLFRDGLFRDGLASSLINGAQSEVPPEIIASYFIKIATEKEPGTDDFVAESQEMSEAVMRTSFGGQNPALLANQIFEQAVGLYPDRRVVLSSMTHDPNLQMHREYNPT